LSVLVTAALLGLGIGALYAIASMGVIVIYRGSGILNFAHGAIGLAAAYLWWELRVTYEWPYLAALAVAVVAAGVVGALMHLLLMRQLSTVSPLARVVATLAVLITIQALVTLIYGPLPTIVASELPRDLVQVGDVALPVDRLILFGIAVVLTAALAALYRYTPFGVSTSAVAENRRAAASLGISPDRIATLNWALGSALAAVAAILVAPIVTLQISTMTTLMLAALAAALVARLRSFWAALGVSALVGIAQSVIVTYVTEPWVSQVVPFLLIVLVMVTRGQAIPLRDFLLEKLPSVGTGRVRPAVVIGWIVLAVVLVVVSSDTWASAFSMTFSAAVVMASIVILSGYTGQLSLAQFALAGFGAFVQGRLVATTGLPPVIAVLVSLAATAVLGLLFALPAIRTRGINLAIITLGLGAALEIIIFRNAALTGGVMGTPVQADIFGWSISAIDHPHRFALVTLAGFVLVAMLLVNVRRSRIGRRLLAVRTNERAAAALGVDPRRVKLFAFGLSAAIAALGGVLIANRSEVMDFTVLTSIESIYYVGFAFFGGIGYAAGPLLGASFVPGTVGTRVSDLIFADIVEYSALIGGVAVLLLLLGNQNGFASETIRQLGWVRDKLLCRGPAPRAAADPPAAIPARPIRRVAPRSLQVQGLSVDYGNVRAVDSVSVRVEPGKVVGLIGPNGAGKTSLIDAVTGFAPMSEGSLLLDGRELRDVSAHRRAAASISRSFQSLELFEDLTVRENLQTASDRWRWTTYLRDLVLPRRSPLPDEVVMVVELFGLGDQLDRQVADLPYGLRRLVAIARATASQPSVILLDEPGAGLSQSETAHLATLVRRLADDWGMAVLLIEHDTDFVMSTCDEILVLDFGRCIAHGTPGEIRSNPEVIAAYLGVSHAELPTR
jgi:sulfate-transporting ATPase